MAGGSCSVHHCQRTVERGGGREGEQKRERGERGERGGERGREGEANVKHAPVITFPSVYTAHTRAYSRDLKDITRGIMQIR